LLPYRFVKALIDALAADGMVESFSQSSLQSASPSILLVGVLCTSVALGMFLFRSKIQSALANILDILSWKNLTNDLRQIFTISLGDRRDRIYLAALLVITLLALIIRLIFITQPMRHDDAYTFLAFASRSFRVVISDYHLPNNHVFHTILVYLTYHLFGNQPWIIRLPALVAGVLIVPATYWVGNMFYNRNTAILSSALVASASPLISYSTNSRLILAGHLILALGVHVKDHKNLLAWILIIILSALGFYTNPTMLYPFGILMTWLLVSALLKDVASEYKSNFFYYLLSSGIGVAFLTILLYTPIIIFSGLDTLIGNSVISSLNWEDFQQSIWVRVRNTWGDWTAGVPTFIIVLLVIGAIISLIFHRKLSAHRFPLQIAAVIWIAMALILQKVAPWPRIWLFLRLYLSGEQPADKLLRLIIQRNHQ
jgi:4-amino-4-deoxy-L-arabinose transferase-like glycosyltransferase